jgi:hypothetical protein
MIDVGLKKDNPGADALVPVGDPLMQPWRELYGDRQGRPNKMPYLPEGHSLFAGYVQIESQGERLFLCDTLEDLQHLWDSYAVGGALVSPTWYSAPVLFASDN